MLTRDEWHEQFAAQNYELLVNDSVPDDLDITVRMHANNEMYRITASITEQGFGDFIIQHVPCDS